MIDYEDDPMRCDVVTILNAVYRIGGDIQRGQRGGEGRPSPTWEGRPSSSLLFSEAPRPATANLKKGKVRHREGRGGGGADADPIRGFSRPQFHSRGADVGTRVFLARDGTSENQPKPPDLAPGPRLQAWGVWLLVSHLLFGHLFYAVFFPSFPSLFLPFPFVFVFFFCGWFLRFLSSYFD